MKLRPARRDARRKKPDTIDSPRPTRLAAGVRRQVEDIYVQLDLALTRLAEIQLQFDGLRSTLRRL